MGPHRRQPQRRPEQLVEVQRGGIRAEDASHKQNVQNWAGLEQNATTPPHTHGAGGFLGGQPHPAKIGHVPFGQ